MGAETEDDALNRAEFDAGAEIEARTSPADTKAEAEHIPKLPAQNAPRKKYVKITTDDLATFRAAAAKAAAIDAQMSRVFGTMGDMQQVVRRLQSEPLGNVELPPDVVAEMAKDFPELAGHVKSSLEKAIKGIRVTGRSGEIDHGATANAVRDAVVARELEALEDAYGDWRSIVGAVDSNGKHDPSNEFRVWLSRQDADYQTRVNATDSAAVIARAIGKFQASKAATVLQAQRSAPDVAARKARIQGAVQPRGDGGHATPPKTDDDEFRAGFNSA